MPRHKVNVGRDHVERQTHASPLAAIEELIWNGLDSGGTTVRVRLHENAVGGIDRIEVEDCGTGIPPTILKKAFGTIGESVKLKKDTTDDGRAMHGREGKGRFKALALCPTPRWETVYRVDGQHFTYPITISRIEPDYYDASDPKPARSSRTGTTVVLDGIDKGQLSLATEETRAKLTEHFAFYLKKYPKTQIIYDGRPLDVSRLIENTAEYIISEEGAGKESAKLMVIEWRFKPEAKRIHICDEDGFSYHELSAGVPARGIEFTAYLCTPHAREWSDSGQFTLDEMQPEIKTLVEASKERLRAHIRNRLAQGAAGVVEEWKKLDIYPYAETESVDPLGQAEREMFDIVAVNINEQHPTFEKADPESKKLTLRLIRHALETNPSSLTTILRDVVALPKQDQDALAELLQRTTLSNLIRAGGLVAERLDKILGFEQILFERDWKKRLLERTQLHRLLVHELWVFGEEHILGTDDESLRAVLETHLRLLGRDQLAPDADVKLLDGSDGIPDLLLYRRRKVDRESFEHLVVELKRPSDPLNQKAVSQIESYAFAVAADERFNTKQCRWEFLLLGNSLDEFAKTRASANHLPEGCIYDGSGVRIWVRNWADVLNDARSRYEFFRERLQVQASQDKGLATLKNQYPHLLDGRGMRKETEARFLAEPATTDAAQLPEPN